MGFCIAHSAIERSSVVIAIRSTVHALYKSPLQNDVNNNVTYEKEYSFVFVCFSVLFI